MKGSLTSRSLVLVLFLSLIASLDPVRAHVEGGESVTVGPYLVQFNSDPAVPIAGLETELSFSIQDTETQSHLHDVRVNLIIEGPQGKVLELAAVLLPSGDLLMTFAFPSDSHHTVTVEILEDASTRRAEFQIEVSPLGVSGSEAGGDSVILVLAAGVALGVGGLLGYLLGSRRP